MPGEENFFLLLTSSFLKIRIVILSRMGTQEPTVNRKRSYVGRKEPTLRQNQGCHHVLGSFDHDATRVWVLESCLDKAQKGWMDKLTVNTGNKVRFAEYA